MRMSSKEIEANQKAGVEVASLSPKLRFPEFREGHSWTSTELGEVLSFQPGYPFESAYFAEEPVGLRLIRNRDLRTDNRSVYYSKDADERYVVGNGDVLVGMDGDFTPCVWTKGVGLLNQRVGRITAKPGSDLIFLFYFLELHLRGEEERTARTTVKHLSHSKLETDSGFLPSLGEQKRISGCLSSVDKLITAVGQKLDALKAHQKGLVQQLFPAEGKTQPRMRFPEFQGAREWSQKLLGDVADVLMCKRIFASETNPAEGVPFYKIGTLGGVPDAFISQERFADYKKRYPYPRLGEVLITCSGTIGKVLPYDGRDAYFQDSNIVWIDNPTLSVSNRFLLSVLSNVDWSSLNSTTITRLYGPDLRGLSIKYPQDHLEQQRIADCLTSLDSLITAAAQELETLKTHKIGLMQQLFPVSAHEEGR